MIRRKFLGAGLAVVASLVTAAYVARAAPEGITNYPVRLGVDDPSLAGESTPAQESRLFEILEQLGLKHLDIHLPPITNAGSQNSQRMAERVAQIDRIMRAHGFTYTFNVEAPNFRVSAEIAPGVNELDRPGGLHGWDLRMDWLKPILPPAVPAPPAFQGIVYDECEHMQLSNNKYSNQSVRRAEGKSADFDQPFLVNTHGMPLETAY